jgi:hypothetical protein
MRMVSFLAYLFSKCHPAGGQLVADLGRDDGRAFSRKCLGWFYLLRDAPRFLDRLTGSGIMEGVKLSSSESTKTRPKSRRRFAGTAELRYTSGYCSSAHT